MKNLLNDPDVMQLYKSLQNKNFEDCEEFLNSNPTDFYNGGYDTTQIKSIKLPEKKVWVDGVEVSDFIESDNYGL